MFYIIYEVKIGARWVEEAEEVYTKEEVAAFAAAMAARIQKGRVRGLRALKC